jgi:predicted nuclease with TOPRIM domain
MDSVESPSSDQRRVNHGLREVLDELIDHVRDLSSRREELTREEIEYAQERLQWLADEVSRLALMGESDQS